MAHLDPAVRVHAGFEAEFPGCSPSAAECMLNLVRAGQAALVRLTRVLAEFQLAPQPFNALAILGGAEQPLTPHEVSDRLLVARSTLTGVLDVLERRGLIERRPHPGHRSMVLVEITAAGRELLAALLPRLHAEETRWWAWLPEEERQRLIALLGRAFVALTAPSVREDVTEGSGPAAE